MLRRLSSVGGSIALWLTSSLALAQDPSAAPSAPTVSPASPPTADAPVPVTAPAAVSSVAAPAVTNDSVAAPPQADIARTDQASDAEVALPMDSEVYEDESPKLEFYGFADANYMNLLTGSDANWAQFVAPKPTFYVGHLNLYLSSTLTRRWRSLAEIRFTYAPDFDEEVDTSSGAFLPPDTTAADYADVNGNIEWSGIEIQRAFIEYQALDYLTIRFGQWLTPYGYWNDDHGSPTILALIRPFPINGQLFPERQTGLQAYGKVFLGDWALAYTLTLSNGRGPYSAIRDLDGNKAIGGRLEAETSAFGDLSFGVAAYRGKYTDSTKRFRISTASGKSTIEFFRSKDVSYDELSLGADLKWSWQGLRVQGEVMLNEAAYDRDGRPISDSLGSRVTLSADYRRWGEYLLVGYNLPWVDITPYVMAEYTSFSDSSFSPPVYVGTAGVNLRAAPNVVLKGEYKRAWWVGSGSLGLGEHPLQFLGTQVAWAF